MSTCIGCGCDDMHACLGVFDEPCHWLVTEDDRGVCSECSEHLGRWSEGDRSFSDRATQIWEFEIQ